MNGIHLIQQPKASSKLLDQQGSNRNSNGNTSFKQVLGNSTASNRAFTRENSSVNNESSSSLTNMLASYGDKFSQNEQESSDTNTNSTFLTDIFGELPEEISVLVEELANKYNTLQDLLNSDEDLEDPKVLIVIMSHLAHLQSANLPSAELVAKLQEQGEKVLPMLFIKEDNNNVKTLNQLLDRFKGQLQQLQLSVDQSEIVKAFQKPLLEQLTEVFQTKGERIEGKPAIFPIGQNQPLSPIHQYVLHIGENSQGNGEKLMRQFQNILGRSTLIQFPNGVNQLTIKLFPEHLGRLDVKLMQQNGVIIAQLMTSTKAAKSVIEAQLHHLRQAFIGQNLQVEKIEVFTQQPQNSFTQTDREAREEHQGQNNEGKEKDSDDNEKATFDDFLSEIFDMEV